MNDRQKAQRRSNQERRDGLEKGYQPKKPKSPEANPAQNPSPPKPKSAPPKKK